VLSFDQFVFLAPQFQTELSPLFAGHLLPKRRNTRGRGKGKRICKIGVSFAKELRVKDFSRIEDNKLIKIS